MERNDQYQRMLKDYGPEVANRYLLMTENIPDPKTSVNTGWVRNRHHQPKAFNDYQEALIRSQIDSGFSCREIASQWGVSHGTISNMGRNVGAYRRRYS